MILSKRLLERQQVAVDKLYNQNRSILVAPTGAGKTIICLTAIKELRAVGELTKVIVACPAKVVSVWAKEAKKWSHTSDLKVVSLVGDVSTRSKALLQDADIIVTSLNSLDWLLRQKHGANGIVVDELSKAAGKYAALLRNKRSDILTWRVGTTATPVSQNFDKLYAMCRIIDGGKALGTSKERYLNQYFYGDYLGYEWKLREGAAQQIMTKISYLVHAIEDNKVNELPPCHHHEIHFEMPESTRNLYNAMKRDMIAGEVVAVNDAVKSGKLRQIASSFIYGADDNADQLDFTRVEEAVKWCNSLEGRKGVIFYEYVAQLQMLQEFLPTRACTTIEDFIDSPILLAQINSLSHGVDGLQHICSDILFYHPFWSRDATQQAIGRVWRTNQESEVHVTTLVCVDTLDELVIERVEDRAEFMKLFMKHLKG
jgi:superfamily II DNA or RNA helicase